MGLRHAVGLAALLGLAGCSHHVMVRSEPSGARLWVDSVDVGTTPAAFDEDLGRTEPYRLRLEKLGYEPKEARVMPLEHGGGGCFFNRPWQAALPDELTFQLFPAASVESD